MIQTKFHSTKRKPYDQNQLIALEQATGNKLEELIEYFGLDLSRRARFYVGPCPIHADSDNKTTLNIFHSGNTLIGNWRCFTHGCHKHFMPTIIGFVRGLLSRRKYGWQDISDTDKECHFHEAVDFLTKFTGSGNIRDIDIDYAAVERNKFASQMSQVYARKQPKRVLNIPKESVIKSLQIPSTYFMSRGYTPEVLTKYDVGLCQAEEKEMYMRATAPIYDDSGKIVVGCTGRMVFDYCPICETYHNPLNRCPDTRNAWKFSKWRHNYGFKGEDHLYNYWFAKDHIKKSGIAIIVESPGNVWRLEEAGIHNSVGTFGAHFTDGQRAILDKSGALALIVLTDPDQAGRICSQGIVDTCGSTYSVCAPTLNEEIGDLTVNKVQEILFPIIENVRRKLW